MTKIDRRAFLEMTAAASALAAMRGATLRPRRRPGPAGA